MSTMALDTVRSASPTWRTSRMEDGVGDMQRIVTVPSQKQCHSDERMGYVALALVMCHGQV
jgi:hypothetical protein